MDYLFLIIGLIVGGVLGYLIALVRSRSDSSEGSSNDLAVRNAALEQSNIDLKSDLDEVKSALEKSREEHQQQLLSSTEWKGKFESQQEKLEEQKAEFEKLQEKFTKDFELIANKILDEKSSKFTEQNKENLDTILTPLKERIKEFQEKVETNNENSVKRTSALEQQLKSLRELNQEITQETKNLTMALRGDSKTQGNWGELQLEMILEKAGLEKDIHYTKETNLKTEGGSNQRLDYIISLPDGKKLILDSKVSLTAYSKYVDSETTEEKNKFLKQHIESVNTHVKLLGGKDYQKLHDINTPDYVLMFVANEPALTLALKEDQGLFEKALDKNIVVVSTSTLLATLRTISYIWKQDLQNKNAEEIARQAGNLYDKFVGFTEDLIKLGEQMNTASKTYDAAMNKMVEGTGNITKRIQDLKKLGVNPSKNIDSRLIDRSEND